MKHFKKLLFYVVCLFPLWSMAQLNTSGTNRIVGQRWVPVLTEVKNGVNVPKAIKGDFVVTGNTVVRRGDGQGKNIFLPNGNNNEMQYVNVDLSVSSWNSSSAELRLLDNNSKTLALDACTKIIYAGLYWTGRNMQPMPTTSMVYNKVNIKGPRGGIQSVTASHYYKQNNFAEASGQFREYVCYADVTEFVKAEGVGNYVVGNILTPRGRYIYTNDANTNRIEASVSDGMGAFGGWQLVVVYENELLRPKTFAMYDGMEQVNRDNLVKEINVTGFITPADGEVDSKFSFFVAEGDYAMFENVFFSGDEMKFLDQSNSNEVIYTRRNVLAENTFDGTINFANVGIKRNPSYQKNWGIDIEYDPNFIKNNGLLANNQTSFTTRFTTKLLPVTFPSGVTSQSADSYWINNFNIAIDTYLPEPTAVGSYAGNGSVTLKPGDQADFRIDFFNTGNEEIIDGKVYLPIPRNVEYDLVSFTATAGKAEKRRGAIPASLGMPERPTPNGYIVWEVGREIPVTNNKKEPLPLASLTYTIRISNDCDKLRALCNNADAIKVEISGFVRGQGKYSGQFIQDADIINKDGVVANSCRKVPQPDNDNSVKVTRADLLECKYDKEKYGIELCAGQSYKGIPANFLYNDIGQGERIEYTWKTYKVTKATGTINNVQKDADGRIIGLSNTTPITVFPGKDSGEFTTEENDDLSKVMLYEYPTSTQFTMPTPFDPATEEIYIEVVATKKNAAGNVSGCSEKDYLPIKIMTVPAQHLTTQVDPATQPICVDEGQLLFESTNKSTNDVTYKVKYRIYKKGTTTAQTEENKKNAELREIALNDEGKAVLELKDVEGLEEGDYIMEAEEISNQICSVSISKKQEFSLKKQAPESKLTSDGKTFIIEPSTDPAATVKYKMQRETTTKDSNNITKIEWKDIKIGGSTYIYATDEVTITQRTEVKVPHLPGKYRIIVTTSIPTTDCNREAIDEITIDKNLRYYYINPNLRHRASTN